jgi:gliding motility-associated-like protein
MTIVDSVKIGQSIGFTLTLTPVGINCKTGNITTTVSGGSNPYSYTWSNGATTANITGVAPGRYFVSVKDSAGCIDTASAVIPGSGLTATISITNPTCVATGTAIVNASGGAAPYTYNWSNGATSSNNTGLTAGTYSVTVTDNTGCEFVQLTTLTNPNPPTISVVPKKDSICSGLSISLTASGGKTYTWNPGALIGTTVIVSPLATTTYTVVGTDSNGCIGEDSVTIKVLPAPTITVSPVKDSVCKGSSVTLTGSGGKSYVWNPVTGLNCDTCTSVVATPTATTTWTIVGTGVNGCKDSTTITVKVLPLPVPTITVKPSNDTICLGDSALLIAGGGGFYTWVFNGSNKDSIWVKPATSTIYTLQVDLDGCIATANKAVIVIGATVPKITVAKDSLCPGDSTSITASGGTAYKWLIPGNPTSATIWVKPATNSTYTCVVTTPCGKDTLVSKLIHVIPFPVITSSGNTSICRGSSTSLTVGGGTKYVWSPGGSTNSTISVNPNNTTTYTVVVSNGTCFKDTTITVTVDTPAVLTITPPSLLCIGDSMVLTATGGPNYKWSTGATTSSITVKPSTTTKYTCVVTKNGCIDSTSTLVTVDVPVLNLCCDKTISPGGSDTIVASGSGNYVWTPNSSLSCDNCDTAIATPTVTTTYTVLSKDGAGCTITKTVTVYVEIPCSDFMVPNVFTPNNDGRNDDFVINVLNPSSYSIDIYDRWGNMVYTSTDATVYWNGRLKGTQYLVSDGVYYYIIKASCGDNNWVKKGFVQVVGEQ